LIPADISPEVRIGCNCVRQFLISAGARTQVERIRGMKNERSDILFACHCERKRSNLGFGEKTYIRLFPHFFSKEEANGSKETR